MSDFQFTTRHDTQLNWKCCQHLWLTFTIDYKLWLTVADRVKDNAQ